MPATTLVAGWGATLSHGPTARTQFQAVGLNDLAHRLQLPPTDESGYTGVERMRLSKPVLGGDEYYKPEQRAVTTPLQRLVVR
jgi:hypothetical protein